MSKNNKQSGDGTDESIPGILFIRVEAIEGGLTIIPNADEDPAEIETLTPSEAASLKKHEATIEKGNEAFEEVCLAMYEILDKRLYRATHTTFEQYCKERHGFSRSYGHRKAQAGKMIKERLVSPDGGTSMPKNEGQARTMRKANNAKGKEISSAKPPEPGSTQTEPESTLEKSEMESGADVIPMPLNMEAGEFKSFKELAELAQTAFDIAGDTKRVNELTEILSELKEQLKRRETWEAEAGLKKAA